MSAARGHRVLLRASGFVLRLHPARPFCPVEVGKLRAKRVYEVKDDRNIATVLEAEKK